jgi:hypothetical protein
VLLEAEPKLRSDLEQALRSQLPEAAKSAGDIVEMVFTGGLNEVLKAIYEWLQTQRHRDDGDKLRELLDGLAALGVDAAWVAKARSTLATAKAPAGGGPLAVPTTTDLSAAEILKAAFRDGPCHWTKHSGSPLPKGEDGFDASIVEPRSPTLQARLEEFREHVMQVCVVQSSDPKARQTLEEHLEVRWQQRRPLYALFSEADGLAQHLANDPSMPWHYLLVMQKDRALGDVLPKPRATALWIHDILDELDRVSPRSAAR